MTEPASASEQEPRRCLGVNANGEPCGVGSELVMDDGYCFSHSPAVRPETRRAAGVLGGIKGAAKRRRGIEVGALETPADAKRITARLVVAIAAGELPAAQGRAALVGLERWLQAYAQDVTAQQIIEAYLAKKGEGR